MSHRRPAALVFAISVACVASISFGDVEPTEIPDMPTVETADACRFTVPARLRPEVVYRARTTFESDREQTVVLFIWAQDNDHAGHWEQRAAFNSYFNGQSVTAELPLSPGRTYLLAAFHKRARSPGYGQPWHQSRLEVRPETTQSSELPPSLIAQFGGAQNATLNVSLTPIELPRDESGAASR